MTLAQIMTTAWAIHRGNRGTFSTALRMAWAYARGFTHAFEMIGTDEGCRVSRQIGFAHSSDEARAGFRAAEHEALKRGIRSLGGIQAINLTLYAPRMVEAEETTALPIAA